MVFITWFFRFPVIFLFFALMVFLKPREMGHIVCFTAWLFHGFFKPPAAEPCSAFMVFFNSSGLLFLPDFCPPCFHGFSARSILSILAISQYPPGELSFMVFLKVTGTIKENGRFGLHGFFESPGAGGQNAQFALFGVLRRCFWGTPGYPILRIFDFA